MDFQEEWAEKRLVSERERERIQRNKKVSWWEKRKNMHAVVLMILMILWTNDHDRGDDDDDHDYDQSREW